MGAPFLLQTSCPGPSSCQSHPSVHPRRCPSTQVQGSAPYTCVVPQEQHGQGQHLLPGAQLPHGERDTRLLGELARDHGLAWGQQLTRHTGVPASIRPLVRTHCPLPPTGATAALGHGQPLEPVVRLVRPLCPGTAGAAAGHHSPQSATGLLLAPPHSGVPAGAITGLPHQDRAYPGTAGMMSNAQGPSWQCFQGLWQESQLKGEAQCRSPKIPDT